jgi:hypothetical protein
LPPVSAEQSVLPDETPLLRDAGRIATRQGTTLRALIEQGLRHVVAIDKRPEAFRLRRVTFRGHGLRPELQQARCERIRDILYDADRGE